MSLAASVKLKINPIDFYRREMNGKLGKRSSREWYLWDGLCPFHADKNPGSFVINANSGGFKCFSCGAKGGDIISFYQQKHKTTFATTIKELEHEWMN